MGITGFVWLIIIYYIPFWWHHSTRSMIVESIKNRRNSKKSWQMLNMDLKFLNYILCCIYSLLFIYFHTSFHLFFHKFNDDKSREVQYIKKLVILQFYLIYTYTSLYTIHCYYNAIYPSIKSQQSFWEKTMIKEQDIYLSRSMSKVQTLLTEMSSK